jgi:hypothetical protein
MAVGVGEFEAAVRRTVFNGADGETVGLPLVVDRVQIVHHEIPHRWPGRSVLGVVPYSQVCPAAHFEHGELLVQLDRSHADLFIEVCCRYRVRAVQYHVAGPDRRAGIRRLGHGATLLRSRRHEDQSLTCVRLDLKPTCLGLWRPRRLFMTWQGMELLHRGEVVADGPVFGNSAVLQAKHVGSFGRDVAGGWCGYAAETPRAPVPSRTP